MSDPYSPYRPINTYLASATETSFDPGHMATRDLDVLSWDLTHEEGQIPVLDMVLRRPGWPGGSIGFLAPHRATWLWFSYNPPVTSPDYTGFAYPLFFGIIIGYPDDSENETVTVRYQARSLNFIRLKQAAAEALKVLGPWDPVTISDAKKDDPDTVLEGYSRLYHFTRTPIDGDFVVNTSDIIDGEDGLVVFDQTKVLYNSFRMVPGEAPLTNIQVRMNTRWTQRTFGFVNAPNINLNTYTGQNFMDQWFKPNQNIGGGWSCESSFVWDVMGTGYALEYQRKFHFVNNLLNGNPDWPVANCNVSEINQSASIVVGGIAGPVLWTSIEEQVGICAPLGVFVDVNGRPITVNIPAVLNKSGLMVLGWLLNCTAQLRYDAKRDFNEVLTFNLISNLQPILAEPTVQQVTEDLVIDCIDVGLPLEDLEPWTSFQDQVVPIATIIWPNNPTTPGGLSFQVCVTPGTAGDTEPEFSDIPGTVTDDNTVQWASLGLTPLTNNPGWTPNTPIPNGTIMCYEPVAFDNNRGTFEPTGQFSYYLAINNNGLTNGTYLMQDWFQPRPTSDVAVVLRQLVPYIPGPVFSTNPGDIINDGTVVWFVLGDNPTNITIPIGGTPPDVTRRNYFSTDRGQYTFLNGIYRGRARLRKRARAMTVRFDTHIENVIGLNCRMNAAVYDQRIYGGVAQGKIIKYTMHGDGKGRLRGHVEVGVPVGLGGSAPTVPGTAVYAQDGYMQTGYQQISGQMNPNPEGDVSYAPLTFSAFDDGKTFPLTGFPGTIVLSRLSAEQAELFPPFWFPLFNNFGNNQEILDVEAQIVLNNLANNPTVAIVDLDAVTNGPFNGSYSGVVSLLEVEEGINLSAQPMMAHMGDHLKLKTRIDRTRINAPV